MKNKFPIIFRFMVYRLICLTVVLTSTIFSTCFAQSPTDPTTKIVSSTAISSVAEKIYAASRSRLLQVRILLSDTGQQSTLGSAFLVSSDGYAITNYHVISQYALEPKTYKLEYAAPDGSHGNLKLVKIDVVNDLAVVKIDGKDFPYFEFNDETLAGQSLKGERLYSMGNPLDLGFTIVEGTYNGLVDHSYNDRIHFSGAINAGMSGGPAVTADNEVVGVNVAKLISGELISFLVPAQFAVNLLKQARASEPLKLDNVRIEIGQQLNKWQEGLYSSLLHKELSLSGFGPYEAFGNNSNWFSCWSYTNTAEIPKPLATQFTTACQMKAQLFMVDDISTGTISFSHTYAKSESLNSFQFASFLDKQYYLSALGDTKGKYYTRRFCYEDFLSPQSAQKQPMLHVVWCAQAYRDFEDLYDVTVLAKTQDSNKEALISRLSMKGVDYKNATAYTKLFIGALQWTK